MRSKAVWFVFAFAVGTAAMFFVWRQPTLTGLLNANKTLRQELQPQAPPAPADSSTGLEATNVVVQLSPEEKTELLRLRGQIQPLRSELGALSNRLLGAARSSAHALPSLSALSAEHAARLASQRMVIAAVAKERYGTLSLTGTKADLPVLQRLLDDHVFANTQTNELQCMGVAFGDILASELALQWVSVEHGSRAGPMLQRGDTHRHVNPVYMISKRVGRGETVDLADLFEGVSETIAGTDREAQE